MNLSLLYFTNPNIQSISNWKNLFIQLKIRPNLFIYEQTAKLYLQNPSTFLYDYLTEQKEVLWPEAGLSWIMSEPLQRDYQKKIVLDLKEKNLERAFEEIYNFGMPISNEMFIELLNFELNEKQKKLLDGMMEKFKKFPVEFSKSIHFLHLLLNKPSSHLKSLSLSKNNELIMTQSPIFEIIEPLEFIRKAYHFKYLLPFQSDLQLKLKLDSKSTLFDLFIKEKFNQAQLDVLLINMNYYKDLLQTEHLFMLLMKIPDNTRHQYLIWNFIKDRILYSFKEEAGNFLYSYPQSEQLIFGNLEKILYSAILKWKQKHSRYLTHPRRPQPHQKFKQPKSKIELKKQLTEFLQMFQYLPKDSPNQLELKLLLTHLSQMSGFNDFSIPLQQEFLNNDSKYQLQYSLLTELQKDRIPQSIKAFKEILKHKEIPVPFLFLEFLNAFKRKKWSRVLKREDLEEVGQHFELLVKLYEKKGHPIWKYQLLFAIILKKHKMQDSPYFKFRILELEEKMKLKEVDSKDTKEQLSYKIFLLEQISNRDNRKSSIQKLLSRPHLEYLSQKAMENLLEDSENIEMKYNFNRQLKIYKDSQMIFENLRHSFYFRKGFYDSELNVPSMKYLLPFSSPLLKPRSYYPYIKQQMKHKIKQI